MSWHNRPTKRWRAYVYPQGEESTRERNAVVYRFEASDYWDAQRLLNALYGNRWGWLTEDS